MSGDYKLEDSVYILFTTRAFATGIPGTLSAATVAVYEDVTATPIETSIAVTESINSIAGLNAVTIAALAASGYNAGGHYHVVIEAGTVDSVSVVGEVVGNFSIQSAPVNWAKVAAPTTAVDLSATDIQLADTVTTYTGNTKQTADHTAGIADIPTVAEFNARTLVAASYFDPAADTVATVTNVTNGATSAKQDTMETTLNAAATAAALATAQTDLDTLTDARGEPAQGAPGVSETTNTKVDWIYKAWRNKTTQTATQWSLYADDTTTVDSKVTVSDDLTTATKGEVATGP